MAGVPKAAKDEAAKLRAHIADWDYHYYVLDAPIVRDAEWDAAFNRLKELEAKHPELITPDSPTQRVGGRAVAAFAEVPHPEPMLSLDNGMGIEELRAWHERLVRAIGRVPEGGFVAEPKIDGLALELQYRKGTLAIGATRGDGITGEDVTANVKTIRTIPLALREPTTVIVRGEAFMTVPNFEAFNARQEETGGQIYKNPRNFTSGAIRQLDPTVTATRPIEFYAYTLLDPHAHGVTSYWDSLALLRRLGFRTNPAAVQLPDLAALEAHVVRFERDRHKLDYWADGLVIKLSRIALQEEAGWTARAPRWALAYKYPPDLAVTQLLDLDVTVGRTGTLTPNAKLAPVQLAGTTVKAASLHNWDELDRLDVRKGDWVEVQKSGEIIPKVMRVLTERRSGKEKALPRPQRCPVCGSEVMREEGKVGYRCIGLACPPQLVRRLEFFASRGALNIEGLGIKIIARLWELGWLIDVASIYRLEGHRPEMEQLEGFGVTSVRNILAAIEGSKTQPLWRVITGLGIEGVGPEVSKILEREFGTSQAIAAASEADLNAVTGIGPVLAGDIHAFFHDANNQRVLQELREAGLDALQAHYQSGLARVAGGPLEGKTVVITGTFTGYSRTQLEEMVVQWGGKATGSVSKNTDLVLIGAAPGSKADKAAQLGIATIAGDAALAEWIGSLGG